MQKIKYKNQKKSYSILIGNGSINNLSRNVSHLCPKTKKIALIVDANVPKKFKKILKNKLKTYETISFDFSPSEKSKSLNKVNYFLNLLSSKRFNRSDLVIAVGGGITGDVVGFVSSIYKRGINFINIPTTLLAQVDSSIGGKTGVNSIYGKNLIGAFYQPKLVIIDTAFLLSLPKKEMICGYAEILKHSIIKDKKFFSWLQKNTKNILLKKSKELIFAIKKSCQIKLFFVNKDVSEKNIRMILNYGHTFAHAIEVKNNYSKSITHGEAVLSGMMLETKLSLVRKICSKNTLLEIEKIYEENNLTYTFKNYLNSKKLSELLPYLKNDKKNDDEKINFILLKRIGKTTNPNSNKISINNLKKYCKAISQY